MAKTLKRDPVRTLAEMTQNVAVENGRNYGHRSKTGEISGIGRKRFRLKMGDILGIGLKRAKFRVSLENKRNFGFSVENGRNFVGKQAKFRKNMRNFGFQSKTGEILGFVGKRAKFRVSVEKG
jgi:hypothetical protein